MRTTIYKYLLSPNMGGDTEEILMPAGAELLHVAFQGHNLYVWAKVNPDLAPVPRRFRVFGTGWEVGDYCGKHVGTVTDGPFVWHVFEIVPVTYRYEH